LRRELRELDDDHREFFHLMAKATAKALREGRASTITTNVSEILDFAGRLAAHLGATVQIAERDDVTDVILRPASCRKGDTA
jgi:hypothetical protein